MVTESTATPSEYEDKKWAALQRLLDVDPPVDDEFIWNALCEAVAVNGLDSLTPAEALPRCKRAAKRAKATLAECGMSIRESGKRWSELFFEYMRVEVGLGPSSSKR